MQLIKYEEVENKIIKIRGVYIIIDSEVAELYGVETKRINEAVKNNPDKFPESYIIELTESEKLEVVENFDHLQKVKFSPNLPKGFTEKGLYMLATILKSPKATETTLAIIDTFAKVREATRNILDIIKEPENEEKRDKLLKKVGNIITKTIMPTANDLEIVEQERSFEFSILTNFKFTSKTKYKKKN